MHDLPELVPFLHGEHGGDFDVFAMFVQLRVPGDRGSQPVAVPELFEEVGLEKADILQRQVGEREQTGIEIEVGKPGGGFDSE